KEAEMPGGPHVSHNYDPAHAFEQKLPHRRVVGDGVDEIRQQFDLVTVFVDEATDEEVVRGTIFERLITSEFAEPGFGGGDGGAEGKFDSLEAPGGDDAREEIGHHADVLQPLGETMLGYG